jgi:hypothetical protein
VLIPLTSVHESEHHDCPQGENSPLWDFAFTKENKKQPFQDAKLIQIYFISGFLKRKNKTPTRVMNQNTIFITFKTS